MDDSTVKQDLAKTLITEEQIQQRLRELAREIESDYEGKDLLIVGVLKGAVMVMADLARCLDRHVAMDWMAISSYGSGTTSSGVVRILKDLDTDITGRHVLITEDIIDTGLTLSWLVANLRSRGPESVTSARCCASPTRCRWPSTSSTSASTSPTSSSSATASTTTSGTATCARSRRSRRTCTPEAAAAGDAFEPDARGCQTWVSLHFDS